MSSREVPFNKVLWVYSGYRMSCSLLGFQIQSSIGFLLLLFCSCFEVSNKQTLNFARLTLIQRLVPKSLYTGEQTVRSLVGRRGVSGGQPYAG